MLYIWFRIIKLFVVLICQTDIIIVKMFVNSEACWYKNKQYNVLINIIFGLQKYLNTSKSDNFQL